jgi:eukaryotic-like serine/threonine-protein kinase
MASMADLEELPPAPAAVESFGRYALCLELASGGMASVYLARSTGPDGFYRVCAIKRIHPHLARQRAFNDMFLDEARIAARIVHPNVCQVFDFGREGNASYLAMEYLSGETFARVLNAIANGAARSWKARSISLVAHVIAEAAEGLHAAHELTDGGGAPLMVVHRDVSPQNVFVTYDGGVKVVDFGIASARDRAHETETGDLKGKFAYMAPEQMRGVRADRRADVWALGVLAWEALTCKRLFRRDTQAEIVDAVQRDPIPPPSSIVPSISEELDRVVLAALVRDRDARTSTARELARGIERAIAASGPAVTRSEVSDWMESLFPTGRARRLQMVELASQAAPAAPGPATAVTEAPTTLRRPRDKRYAPAISIAAVLVAAVAVFALVYDFSGSEARGPIDEQPASVSAPRRAEPPSEPAIDKPVEVPEVAALEPPPEKRRRVERVEPPPPEPTNNAPGCVRIAVDVRALLDGVLVEGPARRRVASAGPHRVVYLDRSGAVIGERMIEVPPGDACAAILPLR